MWGQIFLFCPLILLFCPRGDKGKGTNKKWGQNHSKPYAAWLYALYPAFKRGDSTIIPAIIEKTLRHSCAYAQD